MHPGANVNIYDDQTKVCSGEPKMLQGGGGDDSFQGEGEGGSTGGSGSASGSTSASTSAGCPPGAKLMKKAKTAPSSAWATVATASVRTATGSSWLA